MVIYMFMHRLIDKVIKVYSLCKLIVLIYVQYVRAMKILNVLLENFNKAKQLAPFDQRIDQCTYILK